MKRRPRLRHRFAILLTLYGLLAGCASEALKVTEIYASSQCSAGAEDVRLIETAAELQRIMAPSIRRDAEASARPEIDFDRHHLILIAMGTKPNSGYGIALVDDNVQVQGSDVHVAIKFLRPLPGSIYAQMMTSPCLVVALPKNGHKHVVIQNKTLRLADD